MTVFFSKDRHFCFLRLKSFKLKYFYGYENGNSDTAAVS